MKITRRIDEDLLDRLIEKFGCTSKTEAVEMALREMDRKARFEELLKVGMGLKPRVVISTCSKSLGTGILTEMMPISTTSSAFQC